MDFVETLTRMRPRIVRFFHREDCLRSLTDCFFFISSFLTFLLLVVAATGHQLWFDRRHSAYDLERIESIHRKRESDSSST